LQPPGTARGPTVEMRVCDWWAGDDPDQKARTKPERRRFHVKHMALDQTGRAVEEERWRPLDLDANQTAVREDTLAPRLLGQRHARFRQSFLERA
jgi:hypothetical protein